MSVKRRFSTRWGHPYHRQGACTECRQTLLYPLCSITPMTPEGYTEYSAQSKREDTSEAAQNMAGCAWRRGGRPLLATCVTLPGEDVHTTMPGEGRQAVQRYTVSLCRLALAPPCVRTQGPRLLACEGTASWKRY